MHNLNQLIDRLLSAITGVAVIAMMLHVVAHALMRFFFNAPLYGTNEIVAFWWLPAVALLGIPAAHLQKEHITVTIMLENLNARTANVFRIFACAVGALISLGFAWFGLEEAMKNTQIGSTAGVTDIITWPVYYLVPLVFLMLLVLYILDIVVIARTGRSDVDPLTGETVSNEPTEAPL
ncbi:MULTISPECIES: TRAP transporter small permease [Brevibacterium]|uniref:Tripartite ATP-independent periplasmic transporters DctQ component domain-containing protein n=1 Tax=Brevibacterium salitolerans TaxID=1403566 RepID=A0ABN2WI47_9MICO|nr:TRAP transporter small permease [Brevibacterium sp.]